MPEGCVDSRCSIAQCDIFDFMAKYVDLTVIHPGGLKTTRQLADSLNITKTSKVIDIACGKGTTALYLAENYGCDVVGIDISAELIQEAQKLAQKKKLEKKVTFQVGNAMRLPFPDNSFDVAISQAMLVLVADKIQTIKEANRVIKRGGKAGWLELSWKKKIDDDFLIKISTVLCSYCMTYVSSYNGWEKLYTDAGISNLTIEKGENVRDNFMARLRDEGLSNTIKILFNTMRNAEISARSKKTNQFFKDYDEYFGLGIFVFAK